jgi:hypothetical protein
MVTRAGIIRRWCVSSESTDLSRSRRLVGQLQRAPSVHQPPSGGHRAAVADGAAPDSLCTEDCVPRWHDAGGVRATGFSVVPWRVGARCASEPDALSRGLRPHHRLRAQIAPARSSLERAAGQAGRGPARRWAGGSTSSGSLASIERCEQCVGAFKIIASIEDAPIIEKILQHLGLGGAPLGQLLPRAPPARARLFD